MNEIEFLRNMYPKDTRIVLHHMDDPFAPPSGTKGTVTWVDDIGQIHVNWDNGSTLALNVKLDSFSKI